MQAIAFLGVSAGTCTGPANSSGWHRCLRTSIRHPNCDQGMLNATNKTDAEIVLFVWHLAKPVLHIVGQHLHERVGDKRRLKDTAR